MCLQIQYIKRCDQEFEEAGYVLGNVVWLVDCLPNIQKENLGIDPHPTLHKMEVIVHSCTVQHQGCGIRRNRRSFSATHQVLSHPVIKQTLSPKTLTGKGRGEIINCTRNRKEIVIRNINKMNCTKILISIRNKAKFIIF